MTALDSRTFQQQLQQIEQFVHAIDALSDPAAQASARAAMQAILELHGVGIERMLDLIWETGEVGQNLIQNAFAQDSVVAGLLLLHGLHPLDLDTRVRQAIDKVSPYLHSHGGSVEIVSMVNGVVRLRLQESHNGCSASAMTLKGAIEEAIYEIAPDVTALEIESVIAHANNTSSSFIPLEPVRR